MLVDGRKIAQRILKELEGRPQKKVCFLSFNETEAGKSFVSIKTRTAERLGIKFEVISQKINDTDEAIGIIKNISEKDFDGIVVQLPLGENIDTDLVLNSIPKELDIDLLGSDAKTDFKEGSTGRMPPVAGAMKEILEENNIDLRNKKIVVLGKGRLVGEPVSLLLNLLGHEYVAVDKFTPEIELFHNIKEADIIISGIGVPYFLKPEMIKEAVVLIDAGTSSENNEIKGDINPSCEVKALFLTPVPGGVGPITVAVLYSNLYKL